MGIIAKVIAGGTPAVLAAGAGVMYVQHELHYLLRPSVIETIAGIAAVGGGVMWARKAGKRKAEQAPAVEGTTVDERLWAASVLEAELRRSGALPQGAPHTIDYAGHRDHITHRNG